MLFGSVLLISVSLSAAAPQGPVNNFFKGVGNLLGFNERAGEVDNYKNAPYSVTAKFQGYEERLYPGQNWVCSKGDGEDSMFMNMFRYISGDNDREQKIEMTVPVMTKFQPKSSPPTPTDPRVRIVSIPTSSYLVKTIDAGFPDWTEESKKFRAELTGQDGVDLSTYYTMGYDSPFKLFNRRNEVMFRKL
ncbi:heme-binding protein 2 [Eurytemora carolleeae]|uniref:heme-binding protein 2 n=1 Tax=Eurytemora carolleeae TaxID=1294199 RepID=UPI000C77DD34|nr:heme-binding protein 2 [Eurytemora carolleeae]|eukprot:XP_023327047.1 heme-binding protein 2-like [Eurytemora affinis]